MSIRRFGFVGVVALALLIPATPSFAYEEDTHFLITYMMLRAVGYGYDESLTIAAADQGMDDSPGTIANEGAIPHLNEEWLWHALDLGDQMGPAGILKRKEELFNFALSRPTPRGRRIHLGVFFHYQQDTWAHRHHNEGNTHSYDAFTTYSTPIGHALAGSQPDRPPFDPVCAMLCLEDGIKYAKRFFVEEKNSPGGQFVRFGPRSDFLRDYQYQGGKQDDDWDDSHKGKYFHQLLSEGAPGSPRRFLTELIRQQVFNYTSSIDSNPNYGLRETANQVDFERVRGAFQTVCRAYVDAIHEGGPGSGFPIIVPTKQDKERQGFGGLTTAKLLEGM